MKQGSPDVSQTQPEPTGNIPAILPLHPVLPLPFIFLPAQEASPGLARAVGADAIPSVALSWEQLQVWCARSTWQNREP
jgi:hypothetical protein